MIFDIVAFVIVGVVLLVLVVVGVLAINEWCQEKPGRRGLVLGFLLWGIIWTWAVFRVGNVVVWWVR